MTGDLFDTALLPGLSSATDFVTEAEELMVIGRIDAAGLSPSGSRAGPADG